MQVDVSMIPMDNGCQIPQIGFGTYLIDDKESSLRSVQHALSVGYRHIDTAQMYDNEVYIGEVLREGKDSA